MNLVIISPSEAVIKQLKKKVEQNSQIQVLSDLKFTSSFLNKISRLREACILLDLSFDKTVNIQLHEAFISLGFPIILLSNNYEHIDTNPGFPFNYFIQMPIHETILAQYLEHVFIKKENNHNKKGEISHNDLEHKYIALPHHEQSNLIAVLDITHLVSHNNYTTIYTANKQGVLTSRSIKDYEQKLPCHIFIRVHNSHIVNINFIKSIIRSKNGSLILKDGTIIPISASKRKELINKILL
jgi:two-component system LytT family response regulator